MTDCKARQCWCKDITPSEKDQVRESLRIMQDRMDRIEHALERIDQLGGIIDLVQIRITQKVRKIEKRIEKIEHVFGNILDRGERVVIR